MRIRITWAQIALAAALGYALYTGKVKVTVNK
jgi:hypothetical protein